jgi:hypothetical protein
MRLRFFVFSEAKAYLFLEKWHLKHYIFLQAKDN